MGGHPVDEDVLRDRLAGLTLDRKIRLLTGADFWALWPEPAAGLRRLVLSDGPAGVRGERWDEREPSANVPAPTALAATWDERRVERIGGLLAAECRRKGVDVLLAPTVNLHRTPYAGRHFECFSEDPLLSARIGTAFVRGLQSGGVGATVKHFVANDSETERRTLDARVDDRVLRELYLAPFEAIVRDAGPWAVMAAYNRVNGTTMSEHPMLRAVLKEEWGFDGLVMSDWYAARSTAGTAHAGLDLVMPGPVGPWGDALADAVRAGRLSEAAVDDKVLRLLRLAARVGALDGMEPAAPPPRGWTADAVAAELRSAAAAGFVLARNDGPDGPLLPLDRARIRRIAVLGPNTARARTLGGGSATVFPPSTVSPLEGLRTALGSSARVDHAAGVVTSTRVPVADPADMRLPDGTGPGALVRFLDADDGLLATEHRRCAAFTWQGSVAGDVPAGRVAAIEVATRLRAGAAGRHLIGCSGEGRFQLTVGGGVAFEARLRLPDGADEVEGMMRPPQQATPVVLDAGEQVDVVVRHDRARESSGAFEGATTMQLNVEPPRPADEDGIAAAVALARDADVAVVVVGTTEEVESEGFDRASLALPGRQDELVARVARANPKTVAVVNAGAPVLLPWADDVAAVVLAWFPGQEFGSALADVLLGDAEPGGRLPTTWPASPDGLPSTRPVGGVLVYEEGLFVGYRSRSTDRAAAPRYAFGHGLGYTTWEYRGITVAADSADGDRTLRVRLRNTGRRPGREVVQVYASRPDSGIDRPQRWLVGFAAARAEPGQETTVAVTVSRRALGHWDIRAGAWAVEPGTYTLTAARSGREPGPTTEIVV